MAMKVDIARCVDKLDGRQCRETNTRRVLFSLCLVMDEIYEGNRSPVEVSESVSE